MKLRGEIWWVNFDPAIGQEIKKKRPAVILSNNISNRYLKRYQVVPCSSQVSKLYRSEAKIMIKNRLSKVMGDQLMTVSEHRLINKIGVVSAKELMLIEQVVRLQLGLI